MNDFTYRGGPNRRILLQSVLLAGTVGQLRPLFAADEVVGAVSEVTGEAVAQLNDRRRKLEHKSPLYLGDTINTGAQSRLRAVLKRKTSLRLGANTKVRIDQFLINTGGELVLDSGALLIDISSKLSKGLEVQSPFALIAVRGTRFFAGPIEGIFGVFVSRGEVDVIAADRTVRLKTGEGTDIARPGDAPGPVKKWGKPKIDKAMALVR
jgi:ferric-dicitrate binding protein FerR (iron transport regulator)